MILLRLISWPYAKKHLQRWLLTISGIALGVGVFAGMHTANLGVLAAFQRTIDRIAGQAQLQVSAGEAGFDEEVLERVRAIPGVRAAAAVIEATVSTPAGNLLILGVDMLGDRSMRSYDLESADDVLEDPLVFLAQPDSILLAKTFAEKNGLALNSRFPMRTMEGDRVFVVRGLMRPGGMAEAFGGSLAVMDLFAAQKFLGRGRKFDRIDVALDEGADPDGAGERLRAALGPGFEVEPPQSRGRHFEETSRMYSVASRITSVFALVIGMFLIYNTLAVAVIQRRTEIGVLRALGATRGQIRTLFLAESAVAGAWGSLAGAALGILLARGASAYIGGMLTTIYGVPLAGESAPDLRLLAVAVGAGVVTSVLAGWLPAHAASSVDPVAALKRGRVQSLGRSESRWRMRIALGMALFSSLALLFEANAYIFYLGFVLSALAAAMLTPLFSKAMAKWLRPLFAKLLPVEGTLAADSILQAPRRAAGTIAALMLSVSLVVALGGLARASHGAIRQWADIALNPDFFVTAAETVTARTFTFPAALADGLRTVEGVEEVQPVRTLRVTVKNGGVLLMAADVAAIERRAKLPAVEGDSATMYPETAAGRGVLASEGFIKLHGARLGETLEIPSPSGIVRLPIVGVVRDFSDQRGSLLISRDLYRKAWNDETVSIFRVYLRKDADHTATRDRILAKFGQTSRLFVLTNRDIRRFIDQVTEQWFGLTYIQIAVALSVAVLGVVNALTVSIAERRRELGMIQAVGGLRSQVRRMVWTEALTVGGIGLALGLALGVVTLFYALAISRRDLIGTDIGFAYPWQTAAILIPVIAAASFAASLGPAESAVRGPVSEALEYE
ncbi:MAG: FtsX-like permease family protein [Bryobacteraceae bacterium]|nr:FtsX-like permease family protein [Bryobacteraceae bacterium]